MEETATWLKDVLGGEKRLQEVLDKLEGNEKLSLHWFEKLGAIIDEHGGEIDDTMVIRLSTLLDEFGRLASTSSCLRSEIEFILKKS